LASKADPLVFFKVACMSSGRVKKLWDSQQKVFKIDRHMREVLSTRSSTLNLEGTRGNEGKGGMITLTHRTP
jgi:hypothetical protein